jgi:hypothetical protein
VQPPSVIGSIPANQQLLASGPEQITIFFSENVLNDNSSDSADNPALYLLVAPGTNGLFDTSSCKAGVSGDDVQIPVASAGYHNFFGFGPYTTTVKLRSALAPGTYRLFVCGTTSIENLSGTKLNGGHDSIVTFMVSADTHSRDFWSSFSPVKLIDLLVHRLLGQP